MFSRVSLRLLGRQLVAGSLETPAKAPVIQIVRWRKRRWAPKNASKIYYVRKPTPEDPEEKEDLAWRYKNHRTTMRALTAYFKEEVAVKTAALTSKVETDKHEKEWKELLEINDKWNLETSQVREARQRELEREEEENRLKTLKEIEEDELVQLMKAQSLVQEEMANSKYFINSENLEEEIEKVLNMRTSYRYAIDKEGNRYIEKPDGSTVAETKEADSVRRIIESQKDDDVNRVAK